MKKIKEILKLINLYMAYHLNKFFIIVFILILISWILVLIINTGYPINIVSYENAYNEYHFLYFDQSLFFLKIINGVIISFLVGNEINTVSKYDPMFVSNINRSTILLSKLFTNVIILFFITLFEVLLLELIGVVIFKYYLLDFNSLLSVIYLLCSNIIFIVLGEFIGILINSLFIPILIFILYFVVVLIQNLNFIDITGIYPKLVYVEELEFQYIGNHINYFCMIMVLYIITIILFEKKDLNI